jgi:rubrerythrin
MEGRSVKYKNTVASMLGTQTLWFCQYCGGVMCSTKGKPTGSCPCCSRTDWHQTHAPIAMFEDLDA